MKADEIRLFPMEFGISAETEEATTPVKFTYIPALDGLRAIAVLIVMFYHLEFLIPELYTVTQGGFLGVDVFFVLSGFLITSVLLEEHDATQQISLKNFYLRRFLRLTPAYWLFLFVLFVFSFQLLPEAEAAILYTNNNFSYAFFYLMNWHRAVGEGFTGNLNHTWSLAIEEQFYIFWSFFLYFVFRNKISRRHITIFTALCIAGLIIWRAARTYNGTPISILYYSTDSRMDSLLFGSLASMLFNWGIWSNSFFRSRLFDYAAFASLLTAILIVMFADHKETLLYYGVLSIFAAAIALIILWLAVKERGKLHRVLEMKWLRWIGRISYGLYLWHYAFYEFARKNFSSPLLQVIVGIGLAFFAATVSFYLVERPFLKLKKRLDKVKTKENLIET